MSKEATDKTTRSSSANKPFVAGTLATDFLDTTWRIVVPVVIFSVIGILADRSLATAPWITLLGVVIGFVLAGLLIKKQLDNVAGSDK